MPTHEYIYISILALYDEERQVTKPTSLLQSCRLRTEFLHSFTLHSCRSRYNVSRIFLKGLFFASESDSSGAGTRMAKFST